jgi:N-acetylneuraminic acid mutarotase
MKNIFVLTAATIIILSAGYSVAARPDCGAPQNPQSREWRPAAAFGGPPTWFSAAFTIGDKAYVGTGYDAKNEFWQYDPGRDAWTRKADHPGKIRGAAVAFSIGEKGYLGLGYGDEDRFSDLWEYDPSADHWTQKASLPSAVRDHCGVFAIGSKAYIFGGMTCKGDDCHGLKEVWEYDPRADRWTRKSDMPEAVVWSAYFVLNGKGYIGAGGQRQQAIVKNFWEYDPQADRWMRKTEFPGAVRFRAVGFSINGKGYIAMGTEEMGPTSAVVSNDVWEYDPQTNAWTPKPAFAGPARGAAVGFVLGSRVYIGTGMNSRRELLRDFWWTSPAAPDGLNSKAKRNERKCGVRKSRYLDGQGSSFLAERPRAMARFRNILIHRYGAATDEKILSYARANLDDFEKFIGAVRRLTPPGGRLYTVGMDRRGNASSETENSSRPGESEFLSLSANFKTCR